ncbi:MAG: hypothetical protein V1816_15505 [Pseudomonadota bacterium]
MDLKAKLDLTGLETYRRSCLEIAAERLAGFSTLDQVAAAEDEINAYPHLAGLSPPRDVRLLDVDAVDAAALSRAREAVLGGLVFWEHTAAGEATRLKMGAKYLLEPHRHLASLERLAALMSEEAGSEITAAALRKGLDAPPDRLFPLNLGLRHLLQLAFDVARLARESGLDPALVLSRQNLLLVLNEATAEEILTQLTRARFAGFNPDNFLFMIQPGFPGIDLKDGRFLFDPDSPKRLHNHGQLVMQETMDGQVFRLDRDGVRRHLDWSDFLRILENSRDKVSFNIEDLDYLTGSIDWPSLALALALGAEGFDMVMEIVANDPDHPQKGGLAAYDESLGRNVMIESFQLKGLPNSEIKYLNKNFNHYTQPAKAWTALKRNGLPMPIAVKFGRLFFQPVQGDINFLVPTALVQRKRLKPIRALKSMSNIPAALNAMWAQDRQAGFLEFAKGILDDEPGGN